MLKLFFFFSFFFGLKQKYAPVTKLTFPSTFVQFCIAQAFSFVSLVVLWMFSYCGERLGDYMWVEKGANFNSLTRSVVEKKIMKKKAKYLAHRSRCGLV